MIAVLDTRDEHLVAPVIAIDDTGVLVDVGGLPLFVPDRDLVHLELVDAST